MVPKGEGEGVCAVELKNDKLSPKGRDVKATGGVPKLNESTKIKFVRTLSDRARRFAKRSR